LINAKVSTPVGKLKFQAAPPLELADLMEKGLFFAVAGWEYTGGCSTTPDVTVFEIFLYDFNKIFQKSFGTVLKLCVNTKCTLQGITESHLSLTWNLSSIRNSLLSTVPVPSSMQTPSH